MRILFITSTRIGDAILSTSLLRHLESVHPEARFTVACGFLAAPLFEDFKKIDQIISLKSKKYGKHWAEIWCKTIGTPWDLVIDLRGSALSFLVRTKKRLIWRSKDTHKHRVEQLGDLLRAGGYDFETLSTHLWISPKRLEKRNAVMASERGQKVIAVAPLANWPGKEWPHQQFIQLLQMIRAETGPFPGAKLAFFAAPNEQDRLKIFKKNFESTALINVGNYPHLLDVAALLKSCDAFIGNDSGLMHMAATLGLPTLGLFGPSHDCFYRPWGPKAHFIRTPESPQALISRADDGHEEKLMKNLTVQDVYKTVKVLSL